jgi:thiol-disulfide isomerase/thioredoxin
MATLTAMAAAYYLSYRHFAPGPAHSTNGSAGAVIGSKRPDFRLGSTTGRFVSPADFDGKVLLINFWATWCEPCREEMPMLARLQAGRAASGLQIIGIAMDEMGNVEEFLRTTPVDYPILVGEGDVMQTGHDYGNSSGVLPYSVLVDRQGIIRWRHAGKIHPENLAGLLDKYL